MRQLPRMVWEEQYRGLELPWVNRNDSYNPKGRKKKKKDKSDAGTL